MKKKIVRVDIICLLPSLSFFSFSFFFFLFYQSRGTESRLPYFNSIEQLKTHPTHLLVFMQHVILQFDPAPLVRIIILKCSVEFQHSFWSLRWLSLIKLFFFNQSQFKPFFVVFRLFFFKLKKIMKELFCMANI